MPNTLLFATASPAVNQTLTTLIHRLEAAFPGRIRAYYLHGSYADGSAIDTSDIDLSVIFKNFFLTDTEAQDAHNLIANLPTPAQIDLSIEEEAALGFQADPTFKLAGQLLYGEEIRPQLPLMSIEAWTRDRMHTSYWRLGRLFHRTPPLHWPLTYPDPSDEFYGYIRRPLRLEDGNEITSTRDLIRAVGWMATAIIAWRAKRYVARKADIYPIYKETISKELISDPWGEFIEEVYQCCKVEWRYRIPDQRHALRDLCSRTLAFENHFLAIYRDYLLQEFATGDTAQLRHLLWLMQQIPWQDDQVIAATEAAHHKIEGAEGLHPTA